MKTKQTRTTLKELTARYRAILLRCALINLMLCSAAGAASIDTTDSLGNRYLGSFGIPLKIYDSDTSIGTYYAVASDLMGDATISSVTATLNNASRVGSDNLSWTQSTGAYSEIEFNTQLTGTEMIESRDRIKTVLSTMNNGDKNYDALPVGIKEALQVSCGGGNTCAEYLQTTWGNGSSADIDSVGSALYYPASESGAYAKFNSDMYTATQWTASVSITNSTLTLNDTSAIVNRTKVYDAEKGNISISGSTIITTGTNSFETYTGSSGVISLTGSSTLQVDSGSTLTITSHDNRVSLTNSNLTLNGTVTGNVSFNENVNLKGTGSISGNLDVAGSSVLNMKNNVIDAISAGTVTGGNFSVKLDVDANGEGAIDHITATSFTTGTITIDELHFLSDERSFTLTVLDGDASGAVLALSSAVSSAYNSGGSTVEWRNNLTPTANWEKAFTKTKYTIDTSRTLTVQDNKKLVFTVTNGSETQGETVSLGDTLVLLNTMDSATRTLTNSTSSSSYTVTADLGTTTAGTFTINGAKSDSSAATINMNSHTGFSVASGATLNLQNIIFSNNTAADGSVLTVSGGAAGLSNVTIGNAVSVTSGTLTLSGGNSLGGLANAGAVTLTGNNAVGAMSGAGTLTNYGNLTLTGTTNGQIIGGTGRTIVDAALTTTAAINQAITINGDKTLTADAGLIGGAVTNGGVLALTGGTLGLTVSGGAVHINGNVESSVALSNVTISSGNKLTINAGYVNGTFENNGTLALSGGTLDNAVSGTIEIDGDVTSNVLMSNATINSGKTLTIGAENVGTGFTNNGTVVLTDGGISKPLSGNVTLTGLIRTESGFDFSGASIDATNGALDIEDNTLTAATLTGGTVFMNLKEYAGADPIITTTPSGTVTLDVLPFVVTNKAVQHYRLTSTDSGYSLNFILAPFFAVSSTPFDKEHAMELPAFDASSWTGGDLYIVSLNVAEIAISELSKNGYTVTTNEKNTAKKLSDDVEDVLTGEYQSNYQKVNIDLLFGFLDEDYGRIKAVLNEAGTEATPAISQTAESNAQTVMSVVSSRFGGNPDFSGVKGRSGGDFTVGNSAVWAQGMFNKAKLSGTNGFNSDSTGFAAGFEYNIDDSYKAGAGYAYASSSIKTDRSKTDVDTHTVFIYGGYGEGAFYINGVLGYGRSEYDEKTKLIGLKSDYKADTLSVQVMSGYDLEMFTPEAGLRFINVDEKAYTDALGARIAGKNLQTLTAVAGVKTTKDFVLEKGTLSAQGRAALTYDLKEGKTDKTVSMANGTSYVVKGTDMKRFGLEIGAGVSYKLNGKTEIGLSYEGRFKSRYTDNTGMINIKYDF